MANVKSVKRMQEERRDGATSTTGPTFATTVDYSFIPCVWHDNPHNRRVLTEIIYFSQPELVRLTVYRAGVLFTLHTILNEFVGL